MAAPKLTGSGQRLTNATETVLAAGTAARDRTAQITAAGGLPATGNIVAAGGAQTRQDRRFLSRARPAGDH